LITNLARRIKAQAVRVGRGVERLRSGGSANGVVLLYHRIAQPQADPWNMSVSPENFADHLEILRRFGVPCTLDDFAGRLASKAAEPSVVVTFDDGYADNLLALSMLEAQDVPATIFFVSSAVGNPHAFWWDLLTRVFLETPNLPRQLLLDAGGKLLRYDLGDAATYGPADLSRSARWRADFDPPGDARQRTYLEVWSHLIGLAPYQIAIAVSALRSWAGLPDAEPTDRDARPVTEAEFLQLAKSPLIEIGGHTRTHADISRLSVEQAANEIAGGRRDLIEMTGREVRSFAYPYGRSGPHTIADIRDAGFACAGNSRSRLATKRSDMYALPRVHATNLSAENFEALLSTFMNPLPSRVRQGARSGRAGSSG
jgi:peptidoglycan/xylan/chitin deacetylase (PgdA/CDA1 family)